MSILKIYLFYIKQKDSSGKDASEYYLTSANHEINYDRNNYLPYSGITLETAVFNDSAENYIELRGVFEKNGIDRDVNLAGSIVKIMSIEEDGVRHLFTYICTEYDIQDLDFNLRLEPESIKYNKSLLNMYSKTCRANFCDSKCKLNRDDYIKTLKIQNVTGNNLTFPLQEMSIFEDGYFCDGLLITSNGSEFKILSHDRNNILIESFSGFDFSAQENVTIIPSCDKSFRTCCYSFNNAVNFRGEPAIPESNIIKN